MRNVPIFERTLFNWEIVGEYLWHGAKSKKSCIQEHPHPTDLPNRPPHPTPQTQTTKPSSLLSMSNYQTPLIKLISLLILLPWTGTLVCMSCMNLYQYDCSCSPHYFQRSHIPSFIWIHLLAIWILSCWAICEVSFICAIAPFSNISKKGTD